MSSRESVKIKRVFDILDYQIIKYPQKKALNKLENGVWNNISIHDVQSRSDAIACWFIENKYKKGDKVAIIPRIGRPEWMILDFACQKAGIIVVPIHPTFSLEEINYILNETDAKLCIAADEGLYYKIQTAKESGKLLLYHIHPQIPGYFDPLKLARSDQDQLQRLGKIKAEVDEDDILSIIYTSGTSGIPKGVILTHKNVVSNILSTIAVFPLEPSTRVLSFLPFSHVFERTVCYGYITCGVSLYFSHDRESFIQECKTIRPQFFTSVPRILEKMYDFLQAQRLGKNWFKRLVITKAIQVASSFGERRSHPIPGIDLLLARIFVLNPWKRLLGGRLKCIVVGAASLRPEIGRFFSAAKIKVREGYGMTETSPIISLNRFEPGLNKFGTVGIPVPGVQVKIDTPTFGEEGEILVKGPNVMKGYYKQPELTSEVFTPDGWLKTGDIGHFVDNKFLQITDRKKDIFKTSAGKYVAPQPLENLLASSPYIDQCMILGFNKPFITALIVPDFTLLRQWCEDQEIHWTSSQYMVHNIKIISKIEEEVEIVNQELPNFTRVKKFILDHEEWTVEKGGITATLKPIRKVLEELHSKEIEKMYAS